MSVAAIVLGCGRSTRFQSTGDRAGVPKQFLEFRVSTDQESQQPMYRNVLHGFNPKIKMLVTLDEYFAQGLHIAGSDLDVTTSGWLFKSVETSRGQAETVMHGIDGMMGHDLQVDGYVFVNCDNGFAPGVLDKLVNYCQEWDCIGALTMQVHSDEEKRWSFVDGHPRFFNAYEKQCVSLRGQKPRALCGAYYFPRRWLGVLWTTCDRISRYSIHTKVEPQMSEVLSRMQSQLLSVNIERDEFYDWGTVDAFHQFLRNHPA